LLSDGQALYASCSRKLCAITRQAPFASATLVDEDLSVDFSTETGPDDVVTILATRPLTRDEAWTHLAPDSTPVLRAGRIERVFHAPRAETRGPVQAAHVAEETRHAT
jgi:predicted glutamine amidotransferase